MAGLTKEGLVIKRLGDIITELRAQAVPIFQDLVQPGDSVDTGPSTTIGRFIGLESPQAADLWEAILALYWAFDPNSATGIAHDNLVALGGLTRNPPTTTRVKLLVWGNETTQIGFDQQVSSVDNNLYNISAPITLSRGYCNGMELQFPTITVGTVYGVDIFNGSSTARISTTAVAGDTASTIADKLATAAAVYPSLATEIVRQGQGIRIVTSDYLEYISFDPLSVDTVVRKIRARTEGTCTVAGVVPQEANTVNTIATPLMGWDSVLNPENAVQGKDLESDEELRIRFRDSKFIRAQNITDALYAALLATDGVVTAGVFENDSDSYNATYDLPPHSFRAVVQGGAAPDIARVIWNNKPLGIAAQGNTVETIKDSQNWPRDIRFDRPVNTDVFIKIELKVTDSKLFPANGPDLIRANLIEYFKDRFSIGETVVYSRLYTPINCVPGHQVDSLTIGTSPNPTGTANISIPFNGVASLKSTDIQIVVT